MKYSTILDKLSHENEKLEEIINKIKIIKTVKATLESLTKVSFILYL